MKQVYSILLFSKLQAGRQNLCSVVADTGEEALQKVIAITIEQFGDLAWTPLVTNIVIIEDEVKEEPVDKDKNWLMKQILDNKDGSLLTASERYLTDSERLYITDKLNKV